MLFICFNPFFSFLFSPSVLPARCRCVWAAEFKTARFEDGVCLHKQDWLLDNYFFSPSLPYTRALFHPDLSAYWFFRLYMHNLKTGSGNIPYRCKSSPVKPKCCRSTWRRAKKLHVQAQPSAQNLYLWAFFSWDKTFKMSSKHRFCSWVPTYWVKPSRERGLSVQWKPLLWAVWSACATPVPTFPITQRVSCCCVNVWRSHTPIHKFRFCCRWTSAVLWPMADSFCFFC